MDEESVMPDSLVGALGEFKYEPLEPGHFRVIELHPGSGSDELMCTITSHKLGAAKFTAVSYCWGSPERQHPLKCGSSILVKNDSGVNSFRVAEKADGIIPITTNLRNCLLALRNEEFYLSLWIDSICINQEDVEEKTTQVKTMSLIYDNSGSTVVYLGEPDENTEIAFGCAYLLAAMKDWPAEKIPKVVPDFREHLGPDFGPILPTLDPWSAFVILLDREWFKRVWVIQEIILSRLASVMCGKHRINWDTIAEACKVVIEKKIHDFDHMRQRCQVVWRLEHRRQGYMEIRRQVREKGEVDASTMPEFIVRMNLAMLQIYTRYCGATDPRDKVFALMNICTPRSGEAIPPIDYRMSLSELYTRVAYYWFHSQPSKPIQFLTCVDNSVDADDLPSWVPDWRNKWTIEPLSTLNINGAARQIRSIVKFPEIPVPFSLPLHLTVRGFPLMIIKETEKVKFAEGWETAKHSAMLSEFTGPYPTTVQSYAEAFIRAVAPKEPEDFQPAIERPFTYWRYEMARLNDKALRPAAIPLEDGKIEYVTMEIPLEVAAKLDEKNQSESRPYTQELLYANLPFHYRSPSPVPQESVIEGRHFFTSTNGFMGLVPHKARAGDMICIFFGGAAPVVLRRKDEGLFSFVGECYVYGLMNGEALEDLPVDLLYDFVLE